MQVECPVCGDKYDKQGLENHMRLTNGKGHGPPGVIPDDPSEEPPRFDPEEYEVELQMGEETHEMPLEEAVELSHEMLMNPENFGHVSGQSHRELEERVEELETAIERRDEMLEELFAGLFLLAEKSSGGLFGSGPTIEFNNANVYRTENGVVVDLDT